MSRVLFTTIRVVYGLEGADGDLRSNRVLGRETTHPFHGGHRRHDQVKAGKDGDLRSVRVRGREATHPFHGGHRRHDHFLDVWRD